MAGRRFFINVHVPKCGGTTFQSILERNFGRRLEQVYSHIWEQPYRSEQLAEFIADSPAHDCLSSHRLSLDLPFEDPRFEMVAIILVRDPVSRFMSHYYYQRSVAHGRQRFERMRTMSPDDYADYVIGQKSEHYLLNYQTWYLGQGGTDATSARLAQLAASEQVVLLPLERFDESLLTLRSAFPAEFRDVRYARKNVSPKDGALGAAVAHRLREQMGADVELHQLAHRGLDARLAVMGVASVSRQLARLRGACRRHELFVDGPRRAIKRLARWS